MAEYTLYEQGEKKQPGVRQMGMLAFLIIWIGQIVSIMGSGMTCFAQSVMVYTDWGTRITHLTALAVVAQLPGIIVSPLAGAVVDRLDRRWVMIVSDGVAALGTLLLRMLIVSESYQLWHIYAIVIFISTANHFQWPAYFSSISLMVPKRQLGFANGLIEMGRALSQIAAPFLAAVAVTLFDVTGVITFDLATYVFSLVTLLIVRIPKPPLAVTSVQKKGSLLRGVIEGWQYLASRPGLLGILGLFAASNFLIGVVNLLTMPLALSITTTTMFGGLLSMGGISMLIGGLVMSAWGGPKRRIYGVLGFTLLQGLAIMIAGVAPALGFLVVASVLFYFAVPIVSACGSIIWQSKVPPQIQGRALAASGMVATCAIELAYLIAGPLADNVFEPAMAKGGFLAGSIGQLIGVGDGRGVALMFIIFGALCMLVAAGGYMHPRIRRLDEELPDAIPEDVEDKRGSGLKWVAEAPIFPGDGA
jgi:MFS family permease